MNKTARWLAGLMMLVVMAGVSACQAGTEQDFGLVETPYTDVDSGFQIQFPENWWVQGEPGLVVASSDSTNLRGEESLSLNTLFAPLIVIRVVPVSALGFSTPQNADVLIDGLKEAASGDATLRFKATRNQDFNGEPGRYADYTGELAGEGEIVKGRIYAIVTDRLAATIIAAAPEDDWQSFKPLLDAIIESVNVSGP